MKIRYLAIVPAMFLMTACGGSNPEPETPASESAGSTETKPADDAKPADDSAKPAEGGDATPADKPADAPADSK
ncbi:MAG TPA: hypothetical protein VH062_26515 [Polyangiaceae bacterium]|jgi:hypothetical protein|nr:hypothetical protein [Polyangiaceae bacterium]